MEQSVACLIYAVHPYVRTYYVIAMCARCCRVAQQKQVKVNKPVLRIPTLAIHLTKSSERSSFSPNIQDNFYPVLATEVKARLGAKKNGAPTENADAGKASSNGHPGAKAERHEIVLLEMLAEELG